MIDLAAGFIVLGVSLGFVGAVRNLRLGGDWLTPLASAFSLFMGFVVVLLGNKNKRRV